MGGGGGGGSNGSTHTVFHGTDAEFEAFSSKHIGSATDSGFLGRGFYFSTDPNVANTRKIRLEVSVRAKKPLRLEMTSWSDNKQKLVRDKLGLPHNATAAEVTAKARSLGYDSVFLDFSKLGYKHQEVAVFSERQIKIKKRHRK